MNGKKLYRSRTNSMLAGVCAGVGEYLALDPTLVRIVFIALGVFSGGLMILAYVLMMIVMPMPPLESPTDRAPPRAEPPSGSGPPTAA